MQFEGDDRIKGPCRGTYTRPHGRSYGRRKGSGNACPAARKRQEDGSSGGSDAE